MHFLKNSEIAREFKVSKPTVMRWIDAAVEGKNNLEVGFESKRAYIMDTPHNRHEMIRLVEEGKKFKHTQQRKRVKVPDEFYSIFTDEEAIEIINDLEFKRQMNLKYGYKNGGAEFWDKFYLSGVSEINGTVGNMLDNSTRDIFYLLSEKSKINVIDIGPGNGYPAKHILEELHGVKRLGRYIPVDISTKMNTISATNVAKWIPGIEIRSYERDIEQSRFGKLFLENKSMQAEESNLILYLGNTICNSDDRPQTLKNLRSGMTDDDLLVVSFTIDNDANKSTLNYVKNNETDFIHTWIFKLIGIDIEQCHFDLRFNEKIMAKTKALVLDKDYVLDFTILGQHREITLEAGEGLNVWKHYLLNIPTLLSELKQADLAMLSIKIDPERNYALMLCQTAH